MIKTEKIELNSSVFKLSKSFTTNFPPRPPPARSPPGDRPVLAHNQVDNSSYPFTASLPWNTRCFALSQAARKCQGSSCGLTTSSPTRLPARIMPVWPSMFGCHGTSTRVTASLNSSGDARTAGGRCTNVPGAFLKAPSYPSQSALLFCTFGAITCRSRLPLHCFRFRKQESSSGIR